MEQLEKIICKDYLKTDKKDKARYGYREMSPLNYVGLVLIENNVFNGPTGVKYWM